MPYAAIADLPASVKVLPAAAQRIYRSAFNAAWETYSDRGERREQLSHQTAWAAVKTKYRKNADGEWVAKESNVPTVTETSTEDIRALLQAALDKREPRSDHGPNVWVRDFDPDAGTVVYDIGGLIYSAPYVINDEATAVQVGDGSRVVAKTTYTSAESLRRLYGDLCLEVGRRTIPATSTNLSVMATIAPLLSEGEADVEQAVVMEAEQALAWLKAQPLARSVDDEKLPLEAFAYAGDSDDPSTWRLPMWETADGGVTKKAVDHCAAWISPGGLKGKLTDIPVELFPVIRARLRGAYREAGVDDVSMSRWVKVPAGRSLLLDVIPLTEAAISDKGIATIVVVESGFNTSKERYYPKEMLARDFQMFEGVKMYADHPTEKEDEERPERSIRDWVANLINVSIGEKGEILGEAIIVKPWLQETLAELRDKGLLNQMGVSINAIGEGPEEPVEIEGVMTRVVEKIVAVRSVDFVTEPGAGGAVTMYEAAAQHDVDVVGLDQLRERRPDLVKQIETSVRESVAQEVKRTMELEKQVEELTEKLATITGDLETAKTALEEASAEKAKAEAKSAIDEAIAAAELPDPSKRQLTARFANAETADGIEEAVKAEIKYVAELSEAGKVKGMGPKAPEGDGPSPDELKESFRGLYPNASDGELENLVKSR